MKNLIIIFVTLWMSSAIGQTLEFAGGLSHNKFYNTQGIPESFPLDVSYEAGLGYNVRLGASFDLPDTNPEVPLSVKISLGFSRYKASFISPSRTPPVGNPLGVQVQKSTIDFGFYPINILFKEKLQISIGGELNYRVGGNFRDNSSSQLLLNCPTGAPCINVGGLSHRATTFKINSQFSYLIPLSPNLVLVPQYQFSLGLMEEFYGPLVKTKTMQNIFWIGLQRRI